MRPLPLSVGLLALGGTLLAGCPRPSPTGGLPDTLAAVLVTPGGAQISVLVELPRPGVEPIVRLAPGAVAVDLGWANAWLASPLPGGGQQAHLLDLAQDVERRHAFSGPVELLALDQEGARVRADGQVWALGVDGSGRALGTVQSTAPGGSTTHTGPAGGFAARVSDGRLELHVPREDGEWTAVLHDVERLVGAWWFASDELPPWQLRVVDDRFKQVGILRPEAGDATVDGRLDEWRGQRSLRVDGPSQILVGHQGWTGPRDGGMGVAARRTPAGELVLGVRVRDDEWMPGRDTLVVHVGDREIHVGLADRTLQEGPGWRAAVRPDGGWDRAVEILLQDVPGGTRAVSELMVELVDADPGQSATLLATAPWPAAVRLGALALTPEGPSRPAPQ